MTPNATSVANNTYKNDGSNGANVAAHVRRGFPKYRHNKTDKAIDYKDDLEIHPGPPFVVTGDVHTNGNLYTAHSSLALNGTTTYSGSWDVAVSCPAITSISPTYCCFSQLGAGNLPTQDPIRNSFGVSTSELLQADRSRQLVLAILSQLRLFKPGNLRSEGLD